MTSRSKTKKTTTTRPSSRAAEPRTPASAAAASPSHTSADKVALVTGGAKRVGRAIALRLAETGYHVAITYQSSQREADEVAKEIRAMGRRAITIRADLAKPDCDDTVFSAFTKTFDRCDALINNASIFDRTPIGSISLKAFESNMAVNARAPMLLMQRFAPMLGAHAIVDESREASVRWPTRDAGRIVNFIDIHVMGQPLRGYMAYNMSKAALMEATMTAALELAPKVTVNAIAPGVVAWAESYTPQQRKQYMQRVPLARPGTPEDAAAAVLFLVRDADYCTGQIIRLDGGRLYT